MSDARVLLQFNVRPVAEAPLFSLVNGALIPTVYGDVPADAYGVDQAVTTGTFPSFLYTTTGAQLPAPVSIYCGQVRLVLTRAVRGFR